MSQPATQMTLEALRSVPLFASLDDEAARELRNLLSDKNVPQNTRLFQAGRQGQRDVPDRERARAYQHPRRRRSRINARGTCAGRLLRRDVDY